MLVSVAYLIIVRVENLFMCDYFDDLFKVSEFKDQLLFATGVKPERIIEFSCGMIPIVLLFLLLINIFRIVLLSYCSSVLFH